MGYTVEDFTQTGESFDAVFDAVGKTTCFQCRRLLKPAGVFAATDLEPWSQNPLLTIWSAITGSRRVLFPLPQSGTARAFVEFLKGRMETGEFRAVIDREFPLEAIVDAYRYVETEQKTGIVVIDVNSEGEWYSRGLLPCEFASLPHRRICELVLSRSAVQR